MLGTSESNAEGVGGTLMRFAKSLSIGQVVESTILVVVVAAARMAFWSCVGQIFSETAAGELYTGSRFCDDRAFAYGQKCSTQ